MTDSLLSLLSVLGGGVVSAIVVSSLTSRRDLKDYKRKKHEELYEIIRTDGIAFFDCWIRYQAAFEGSIALKDVQQSPLLITDGPDRKTKAEMLVNLYAPKLISSLQGYCRTKQSLVLLINEMVKEGESATSSPHTSIGHFHNARAEFEQARQKLFDDIALQSGKL